MQTIRGDGILKQTYNKDALEQTALTHQVSNAGVSSSGAIPKDWNLRREFERRLFGAGSQYWHHHVSRPLMDTDGVR